MSEKIDSKWKRSRSGISTAQTPSGALTQSMFPAERDLPISHSTIGENLQQIANDFPHQEALVEITQTGNVGRRWTYSELYTQSQTLAQALASRFNKGAHIVVWSPNSPEWVLMEYAAAIAGLVIVTANPALQESELRYVVEQSDAVAIFLVNEFRGNPMSEIAQRAVADNSRIQEVIDLANPSALFKNKTVNADLPDVQPDDAAQIQYTSGTTGFPKGAVLSHLGLINNAKF